MTEIVVLEAPCACSSGGCDDEERARFGRDVARLTERGLVIRRHGIDDDDLPAEVAVVRLFVGSALPAVLVDGRVVVTGSYPTGEELERLAG